MSFSKVMRCVWNLPAHRSRNLHTQMPCHRNKIQSQNLPHISTRSQFIVFHQNLKISSLQTKSTWAKCCRARYSSHWTDPRKPAAWSRWTRTCCWCPWWWAGWCSRWQGVEGWVSGHQVTQQRRVSFLPAPLSPPSAAAQTQKLLASPEGWHSAGNRHFPKKWFSLIWPLDLQSYPRGVNVPCKYA